MKSRDMEMEKTKL